MARDRLFPWILIAAAVFAIFAELGRMDVWSDNEGQRATPPAEMLRSGNFVVPTINGETYLNKPPLLYWAIAAVYAATGRIDALTARIPTAVCGLALVLFAYFYLRRRIGETPARWAALTILASPYVLQMMRVAELDIPLTLATFAAVIAYYEACLAPTTAGTVLLVAGGGLALGAAILLKGPVPFLFLAPAWAALLVLQGDAPERVIRAGSKWTLAAFALGILLFLLQLLHVSIGFPVALAVFAAAWLAVAWRDAGPDRRRYTVLFLAVCAVGIAVAAPWAVAVLRRLSWDYLSGLLQSQVTERTYVASRINSGSPLFYLYQLPVMLAPWGFLLPLHFSRKEWADTPGFYRFAVLAGWLSVAVFSLIAGKETEYVLPAVPLLLAATGVHIAHFIEDRLSGWTYRWTSLWVRVLLVALVVLVVAAPVYVLAEERYPGLILETAVFAVLAVASVLYSRRHKDRRLPAVFAGTLLVLVSGLIIRSYHYAGTSSPQDLARLAGRLAQSGYRVETIGRPGSPNVYPGFAFYAGTVIPVEMDPEAVRRKLASDEPYFYIARKKLLDVIEPLPGTTPPLILTEPYTNKDLILIGNRPLPTPTQD